MNIFPTIALSPLWPAHLTWHFISPLFNHLFIHSLLVKTLKFFPVIYNSLLFLTDGPVRLLWLLHLCEVSLLLPYFPAHQDVLGPPYLPSCQPWNKSFLSRALFLLGGPTLDTKLGIWMSLRLAECLCFLTIAMVGDIHINIHMRAQIMHVHTHA